MLLILGLRVKARAKVSCERSEVTHGSTEIGNESLHGEGTDASAYDTPGGITRRDTRGITTMIEVHTYAYP